MAGFPIVYQSRYQLAVALSSTEAKFVAKSNSGKQTLYVRSMLNDIATPQLSVTELYCDNVASIVMANEKRPT